MFPSLPRALALTLPQPSMPVFSGNPVDYCDFIRSFEHLIESKTTSPSARLYYLVQHTSGSEQELMKSCLSMKEDEGYEEARKLLKERYGKEYRVAAAHLQRLVDGPPIKSEDANALQQFSIQLTSCTNTLEKIGYLHKLNNSENLKRIVERLPYAMRVKWRDTVDRIVEIQQRDVTIKDINKFVTAKARAANHPVFGKIAIEKPKPLKQNQRTSQYGKATGFATQSTSQSPKCPQCGSNHWLSRCDKFKKQSLEERQKFVREKKLCINCLSTGHFVRSCEKESFCKVDGCVGKHSTFLHPKLQQPLNTKKNDSKQKEKIPEDRRSEDNHSETQGNNANNGYVKSKPGGSSPITGLAIVPIEVKAKGSSKTVKTYAFLDSGSNTTFCTEKLLEELEIHGTKTKLSLTTMQAENVPEHSTMVSLEILDLAGNSEINLPTVYSRPNLPIPKDAIGRQEDVNRWPYLTGIRINSIDADIGLLIGSDVPEALQPREMRQSQNGGPFATRTALGWVLNGPLGRNGTKTSTANLAQANLTSDEKFENYCNYEFNDYKYDTNPTMSQNDRKALGIMEESVKMENGHYEIALPWKKLSTRPT
ncbi:uncharacterized protein LOC114542641 [Dendronephthya gigantea]|uniref:uncharacterized protein LOC114542641 n=1 Tax=Dendronephthya gigantea TaxID=151771 RepID=UPI001069DA5B|nr:uncharacterized protein LOC114542641 [Dendronephthya gigantea]